MVPPMVTYEPPDCGELNSSPRVTTGALNVNSPSLVDPAAATVSVSSAPAKELFGDAQESDVTLCQEVVAHPVVPTLAEGLALL